MKKDYFLLLFLLVALYSYGQEVNISATKSTQSSAVATSKEIKGFAIYPNPASNGIVYINTFKNVEKTVQIFDVLGKLIFAKTLATKFVNVSRLKPGVYILKVFEEDKSSTRKLVIK